MGGGKFASITAGLLARKGEARPWPALAADEPPAPPAWRPAAVAPPPLMPAPALDTGADAPAPALAFGGSPGKSCAWCACRRMTMSGWVSWP